MSLIKEIRNLHFPNLIFQNSQYDDAGFIITKWKLGTKNFNIVCFENYPTDKTMFVECKKDKEWTQQMNYYLLKEQSLQGIETVIRTILKYQSFIIPKKNKIVVPKGFVEFQDQLLKNTKTDFVEDDLMNSKINNLKIILEKSRQKDLANADFSKNKNLAIQKKIKQVFSRAETFELIYHELVQLIEKENETGIIITIVNETITDLNVKYTKFENLAIQKYLKKIKKKYGYGCFEFSFQLNEMLYPFYPPTILPIRPKLSTNLSRAIVNLEMVKLEFWNPTRGISYVIPHLKKILNENLKMLIFTEENDPNKYPQGAYLPVEKLLMNFSSITGIQHLNQIDQYLDEVKYPSNDFIQEHQSVEKKSSQYVNAYVKDVASRGLGYVTDSSIQWDVHKYREIEKANENNILVCLKQINQDLEKNLKDKKNIYADILNNSCLVNFMIQKLSSDSLMNINGQQELYSLILNILHQILEVKELQIILSNKINHKTLGNLVDDLHEKVKDIKSNDSFTQQLVTVTDEVSKIYRTKVMVKIMAIEKVEKKPKNLQTEYVNYMKSKVFNYVELDKIFDLGKTETNSYSKLTNLYSQTALDVAKKNPLTALSQKRLMFELHDLAKLLPVNYESSILLYVNEVNIKLMRCVIIGPEKTPYENGWFEFDLLCDDYPNRPPHTTYLTRFPGQDNHTLDSEYKFNPNIYADGSICLSLLGTFKANSSAEGWNPEISTLLQLFLSLQTSMFVEKPFFNEGPNQKYYGTDEGEKLSREMNERIQYLVMKVAIVEQLKRKDYFLYDVIKMHFKYKKHDILKTCEEWSQKAQSQYKQKIIQILTEIKKVFEELK